MAQDTLANAYRACCSIAAGHYENFPVASLLLPRHARNHLAAIYAFARGADDFADEPDVPGDRIALLNEWEGRLDAGLAGDPGFPVFQALANTIRETGLPVQLLRDLLEAFRDDVRRPVRETFEELIEYSTRSANPVGRLVLWVCGYRDEERARLSDSICTALQLTNFWQDIGVDRRRGRVYLPSQERHRFGYTDEDFAAERVTPAFVALLSEMIGRTRARFREGAPLCLLLRGRLSLEVRLTWLGSSRILDRIETAGYDVFRRRPTLRKRDGLSLLGRALIGPPR